MVWSTTHQLYRRTHADHSTNPSMSLWNTVRITVLFATIFGVVRARGLLIDASMASTSKATHTMARQCFSVEYDAFRFERPRPCRKNSPGLADAVRLLHSSPLAEERFESLRGDRSQHPSHRPLACDLAHGQLRWPKFERWTQVACLGALEF